MPSPRAEDSQACGGHRGAKDSLLAAMKPTPSARDHKSGKASEATMNRNSRPLNEQATQGGGQLHPRPVEWMMGLPLNWVKLGMPIVPTHRKNGSARENQTEPSNSTLWGTAVFLYKSRIALSDLLKERESESGQKTAW